MSRKLRLILGWAVLTGSVGSAAVSLFVARHFYVQSKVGMVEPVRLQVYRADNERLLVLDRARIPRKPRVVLIGDSGIRRWDFDGTEQGWDVVNRGIGGETSAQLRFRFEADALALRPDVIVIRTGANDLVAASLVPEQSDQVVGQTIANVKELAARGARANIAVVLVTLIPPAKLGLVRRLVWGNRLHHHFEAVNRAILEWEPPKGVIVVDQRAALGAALSPAYAADALHLNSTGYIAMTPQVADAIREALHRGGSAGH
jgi:lysophospholipase L1-like esterase